MTTTTINNIHNLKHFNQIQTLLQIEDLEVFATEINFLYEKLEQYASEIDAAVKNSELMKAAINDYENERQYLMDKIAEMQGTTNIYVFDKEDEYNDIQIQQEQEQQEQEEKESKEQEQVEQPQQKQESEEQEQQEETYIYNCKGLYNYYIKQDDEYIKRKDNKSPLEKYNTLEDYINNFSIYDKEDKKAVKKAIVEDFKKAGYKVKANNGNYYCDLDIILEINKNNIVENDVYSKAALKLYDEYDLISLNNCYNLNLDRDKPLYCKENINTIKEYFKERINLSKYSRYSLESFKMNDKKCIEELFYKDDEINKILITAKNIIFKYSILKSYDAYSDYGSSTYTFDFDLYIKLV